ncbi:putative Got1 family protein [Giardia muris]|uniref:Putative Got1 family protein n=1 Tax=Giardia muris TaxID=5742 RepID=A0A4Z1SY42_GIAMU|nr:putative Got1 family protein [Giardia muris]|eukprot:TNJ30624.1 putative Got1 family protein [Giardia muris]
MQIQDRSIGMALMGFGLGYQALGMLLLFDRGFIALGNIVLTVGVIVFFGPQRIYHLLFKKASSIGIIFYATGMILVLRRVVVLGGILQVLGLLSFFRPFTSLLVIFIRRIPVLGPPLAALIISIGNGTRDDTSRDSGQ